MGSIHSSNVAQVSAILAELFYYFPAIQENSLNGALALL